MRKLISVMTVAALLASGAAPSALASGGQRHHGIWSGHSYYTGHYFRHRHHRRGGHSSIRGGGAVVLGILAGAVVLGALLSRPPPAPARPPALRSPPVPRSPSGAPLGGCLRTTGTGAWYGRPARFSGTMCYDPAGRAYVLPGSERFVEYLR